MILPRGTHDADTWRRLLQGASLETLGLQRLHGRIDLRGLTAPRPPSQAEDAAEKPGDEPARRPRGHLGRLLEKPRFSNSQLPHLRFEDCVINNCRFDRANCNDWQLRGTTLINCSFRAADLRNASLDGIGANGKRNSFRNVDFRAQNCPQKPSPRSTFQGAFSAKTNSHLPILGRISALKFRCVVVARGHAKLRESHVVVVNCSQVIESLREIGAQWIEQIFRLRGHRRRCLMPLMPSTCERVFRLEKKRFRECRRLWRWRSPIRLRRRRRQGHRARCAPSRRVALRRSNACCAPEKIEVPPKTKATREVKVVVVVRDKRIGLVRDARCGRIPKRHAKPKIRVDFCLRHVDERAARIDTRVRLPDFGAMKPRRAQIDIIWQ